jgi:hypothetical protein
MGFRFWQRWMLIASLFFTAFGILAALAPDSVLFELWISEIDRTFFMGPIDPQARTMRGFLMGPLGGTIAGSYLLQSFVVAIPFKRKERWAWHAIVWSTLLWFAVDSLVSALHGAYFNIYLINLMPLVIFGIPLLATRSAVIGTPSRAEAG